MRPRWTKEEVALLKRLYRTHSNSEIAGILGRKVSSVVFKDIASVWPREPGGCGTWGVRISGSAGSLRNADLLRRRAHPKSKLKSPKQH